MERQILQLPSEFRAAILTALSRPSRELRIFDPDLSALALSSESALSHLHLLFSSNPLFRFRLALRDDAWLRESAPRLRSLLETRSTQMEIRIAQGEALKAQDCFLLSDTALVKKAVSSQNWGVAYYDDPEQHDILSTRWNAIWDSCESASAFRSTGL